MTIQTWDCGHALAAVCSSEPQDERLRYIEALSINFKENHFVRLIFGDKTTSDLMTFIDLIASSSTMNVGFDVDLFVMERHGRGAWRTQGSG